MAQTAIYKLKPRGAFHFGERGVGVEETADLLHSDTLFSAFVSAWRALGEQPDPSDDNNLPSLSPFVEGQPPFRISSALPYAGDVLLFPCPLVPLSKTKALKKVAFVSEGALHLLGQGQVPDTRERQQRELLQSGRVWVAPEEREIIKSLLLRHERDEKTRRRLRASFDQDTRRMRLWSGSGDPPAPHVAVDRVSLSSNLFFAGRLQFAPECGLYFWVDSADPGAESRLLEALTFLQDEGVGGRRTTGHGQFTFERLDRSLPSIDMPDRSMTLSLYRPSRGEVQDGVLRDAWYRRLHRRGWIYSPEGKRFRRRGVWMLAEGTVVRQSVSGTMEDVRPDPDKLPGQEPFPHPVWRYGYAFTMPVRLEGLA